MLAERNSTLTYAIREIASKAAEAEARGKQVLKLNIGDPLKYPEDFPVPEAFVNGIKNNLHRGFYSPSEGVRELRQAISEWETRKGAGIDPKHVFVANGVSEAVFGLFGVMLNPGDEVVIPRPVYPIYEAYARFFGARPVFYDARNPDVEEVQKLVNARTKAIVVINPNNPLGVVHPAGFVKGLTELGPLVISDEIYDLMTFGVKPVNAGRLADSNLVVLNGFSKVFLAPGYRLGYACFKDAGELEEGFVRYLRSRLCSNTPMQYGAVEAIREGGSWIKETNRKLETRRDAAYEGLRGLGLEVPKPEGAFYIFPGIGGDDLEFALGLIEEEGVAVVHGSGFADPGHFRMVFLPPEEQIREAVERIGRFLERHPEHR
ncbi:MAG TPA: aminotransferase class I/II-fold pyridoxal phosphate-dependent enzyme [archaeon]|nr:aminotransferase class I/II-fold pyridoxal phosphate-dependent enzyme [archaeon]